MLLGIMELAFVDSTRRNVKMLRWNGKVVAVADASASVRQTKEPASLSEVIVKQQQRTAEVLLRNGQAEFRHALDLVYGAKCCISGCPVPSALVAAHISAYADSASHSPKNGLLLRSDLHCLFDAHQLAIHPITRLVYFADEAKAWKEYARWHGKKKLAHPQPGRASKAPQDSALETRWKQFVAKQGDPTSAA